MIEEGRARLREDADAPPLGEREELVLSELAQRQHSQIAFQGLRRKLDLHQEILSRTLRRLERDGLVRKQESGYALTDEGLASLRGRSLGGSRKQTTTIVEAMLPPQLDPTLVSSQLTGRWFRGLRWYGSSVETGVIVLTWLTDPGNEPIRLRVGGGRLVLETEAAAEGSAASFTAARSVLAAIAELYGMAPGLGSSVVAFSASTAGTAG